MGQYTSASWVQVSYGSTNAAEHTEGEDGGVIPADPLDAGSENIQLVWRWRSINDTGADPRPSHIFKGDIATFPWSGASRTPIRQTFTKQVPTGQYEVRLRRVSPASADSRVTDEVAVGAVRSIQTDNGDYSGRTISMVRIRATGQLNGIVRELNGVVQQQACYIKPDGSPSYIQGPSSNPARVLLAWLRGGFDEDGKRLYGGGLPLSRIDTDNLDAFYKWCASMQLYFDAVIDTKMTVYEVASRIARCGRAALTCASGKWGVVWDEGGLPVTAMFTPMNMLPGTFNIDYSVGDQPDEIVLNFIDRATWKATSVYARAPGVTAPQRSVSEEMFGGTVASHMQREARLKMAEILYRSRRISWQTDIEGLTVRKGDVVSLSHDMAAWGVSGRLISGTPTAITLDRAVTLNGAQQYIAIITPAGFYQVCRVQVGTGAVSTLTLLDPIRDDGGDLLSPNSDVPVDFKYQFDALATPGWRVKIVAIDPAPGLNGVKLTAVDDVSEYYNGETGEYGVVKYRVNALPPLVRDLRVGEEPVSTGSGYAVRLTFSWVSSGAYSSARIYYSVDGSAMQETGFIYGSVWRLDVSARAVVQVTLVPFDGVGRKGGVLSKTHTVMLGRDLPARVPFFVINGSLLTWGAVSAIDLAGYRIRWQSGNSLSWGDAIPLHDGLLTSSPYDLKIKPSGQITLMIKAVDVFNNESDDPAAIFTELGDALASNVVEDFDMRGAGFAGAKTACAVVGGDLKANVIPVLMWKPDENASMWSLDGLGMWNAVLYAQMRYEEEFQPSVWKAGTKMLLVSSLDGESQKIEYRMLGEEPMWSSDGALMWSGDVWQIWSPGGDWLPWPGTVQLVQNAQYALRVTVGQGPLRGSINALKVLVDYPDIVEYLDDITIASGGSRLPVTAGFSVIKNIKLTLQDDGAGARSILILDKNAALGPLVKALNSSNANTTATIDATIKGY